jgi:hypothetical protein
MNQPPLPSFIKEFISMANAIYASEGMRVVGPYEEIKKGDKTRKEGSTEWIDVPEDAIGKTSLERKELAALRPIETEDEAECDGFSDMPLSPLAELVLNAAKTIVRDEHMIGVEDGATVVFTAWDIAQEIAGENERKHILKTVKFALKQLCLEGLVEISFKEGDELFYELPYGSTAVSPEGISKELDAIKAAMAKDSDFAWTWHCNIAVCFMDEGGSHKAANLAASRFMKTAFDVDVTKFDLWKQLEESWKQDLNHPVQWIENGWFFRGQRLGHYAYAVVKSAGTPHARFLSYGKDGCGYQTVIRNTFTPSQLAEIPAILFTDSTTVERVYI